MMYNIDIVIGKMPIPNKDGFVRGTVDGKSMDQAVAGCQTEHCRCSSGGRTVELDHRIAAVPWLGSGIQDDRIGDPSEERCRRDGPILVATSRRQRCWVDVATVAGAYIKMNLVGSSAVGGSIDGLDCFAERNLAVCPAID